MMIYIGRQNAASILSPIKLKFAQNGISTILTLYKELLAICLENIKKGLSSY